MKIVYFGTSDFAVPALRVLAPQVILVVSQPDRPSGRGMKLKPSPVKAVALQLGIPVETPERARDAEFVETIAALRADIHVVAAYGQILSMRLLETATRGGVNLHGSILPRYRGAAPIQRAIFEGETETGVTLMQMAKGMDTGDMIDIVRTPIHPDETYGELQERLSVLAASQVGDWIERLVAGDYPREVQDETLATYAPKIDRAETELSFTRSAGTEYRRFRAFTPNPSCFINTSLGRLKVTAARLATEVGEPGAILSLTPLVVGFREGALQFDEVQPEGKPRLSASDWANGQRLVVGTNLSP
jgi:methionyl-tRNA formyltransferase